jgi:hypothetical protein
MIYRKIKQDFETIGICSDELNELRRRKEKKRGERKKREQTKAQKLVYKSRDVAKKNAI